jgi:hypothetical protein
MAHFAQVTQDGEIIQIVVVSNEDILDPDGNESEAIGIALCESQVGPGPWIQTSYSGSFRRHYAGVTSGVMYDKELDAFILPKPHASWILDLNQKHDWSAPIPIPNDPSKMWIWDEDSLSWIGYELPPKPSIVTLGD